jgi:hypothetical protein
MSTETQRRTLTVETEICPTRQIADGQRLAWDGDGAISMTVRIGPHSMWFSKETSPAGIGLSTDMGLDDAPSWPIGGGGRRPSAAWKLATLLQSGWELVDDDVGLNR